MVTITITAEAFASIAGTLVEGSKGDARPDGKGGYLIVLSHAILDRLKTMRGPGESYSDVIIALAKGGVGSAVVGTGAGGGAASGTSVTVPR